MNLYSKLLLPLFILFISPTLVNAQSPGPVVPMEMVTYTADKLTIAPASTSSENDFRPLLGKWKVKNRKLKSRLANNHEWIEFDAVLETETILRGMANKERYTANINGKPFEAIALRLFNPKTNLWTDYWADNNDVTLDQNPVVGSFVNKVGSFFARDTFEGKEILVVYQWDFTDEQHPQWRQAYSEDRGATWEWNWYMDLSRVAE